MGNVVYNGRATVVKEISHIHFAALTKLHLDNNRIESIEGLARAQMSHMHELYLGTYGDSIGNNNIAGVRVLRKAAWPALSLLIIRKDIINVGNNYFGDAKTLVHGSFPKMEILYVY